MKRLSLVAFAGDAPSAASAAPFDVTDAWFRACRAKLPAGGYFTAQNNTGREVSITGVHSGACGMLMMHQSANKGGMSGMDMVDKVTLPAGGIVNFAPGGYHLMCEQPKLKIGTKVPVVLTFPTAPRWWSGSKCATRPGNKRRAPRSLRRGGSRPTLRLAAPCYGRPGGQHDQAGAAGSGFRQMRGAADPVPDAALFRQLSRPGECRLRGPDHEPGPGLFALGLWLCRQHLFHQLCAVPDPRHRPPGTDGSPARGLRHHGGLGRRCPRQPPWSARRSAFMPRAFCWAWRRRDFSRASSFISPSGFPPNTAPASPPSS